MRKLSELEGVSLGIIHHFQPCTAYFVRCQLRDSPSTLWQASAGSVYPLVSRLENQGLIKATEDGDKRGRKNLTLTERGVSDLQSWVLNGSDQSKVAAIMDPLRNRIAFLSVLDDQTQMIYLDQLLVEMKVFYEVTKKRLADSPKSDDLYKHMVALGAMQSTQSRLNWLSEVKQLIIEKHAK